MQQKPVVYAWVFARGGSKGLPRKNILPLAGKPLIAHSITIGLKSVLIDRVFVSTDDPEIAEVAKSYGAEVPFLRPKDLASDTAPERMAWRHAVQWLQASSWPAMEVMVSLPPTAPLRTLGQVEQGITRFLEGGVDTVLAVSRSNRHPSFNMVELQQDGSVTIALPPNRCISRRQDLPPLYDIATSFYVTSPECVLTTDSLWSGRVGAVEVAAESAVDVDTLLDFQFAEFLLLSQNREIHR